ncbi:hypothetical protein GRI55_11770 [Erythrobacter citreus]|uniref:Uncharacterized protein n=1 Tax=Qipengyuania citrea TaxID=225971 RepID=A0A6I4UDM6_9SPHN|nr:hypothetical protein [Qipengyuania citrea]MDQ0564525.1 hypothetical protein [Qipengyuania citrea]MXP36446.1 hypothetical protein [Qipengyuania citrea]
MDKDLLRISWVDSCRGIKCRVHDGAGLCTIDPGDLMHRRAQDKHVYLIVELAQRSAPATLVPRTPGGPHGALTEDNTSPHAT